jgi:hypothetical protein
MKSFSLAIMVMLLSASALAASPNLKPGLWEHTVNMTSESGEVGAAMKQMQEQLAQMPPEQRQMAEQMMAAQGITFGPRGSTIKVCLTAEDIAKSVLPHDDDCQQDIVEQTAKRWRVKFHCPGNPPTSGEGEVVFHSDTHYTGKATLETQVNGKPERMTMEQTGKWLSADCGDLAN